ncbi:hypothetical protein ACX0G9_25930 [Flavitalea flava]
MKKLLYIGYLITFGLSFYNPLKGQNNLSLPQITPKSPDAAGLGKYGEVPVSLSTGMADISIDLDKISVDGLEIPLKLTYHNNGLQIDEIPSSVGLGWDLQVGGAILYQQRGNNDFDPQYGLYNGGIDPLNTYFSGSMTDEQKFWYLTGVVNNDLSDTQFDLYTLNFLGINNSFYFDPTWHARTTQKSDLKISKTALGFMVIDYSGNKFYFESTEYATMNDAGDVEIRPSFSSISAFRLSKIVTKNNREIKFFYKTFNLSYTRPNSIITQMPDRGNKPFCPFPSSNSSSTFVSQDYLLLDSLSFDLGYIKFSISNDSRQDISSISASNVPSVKGFSTYNSNGTLIKQFLFTQNYSAAGRLTLQSIQERNTSVAGRNWAFTYYGGNSGGSSAFFSTSKDHWGYYNGKSNMNLFPKADYSQILPNWIDMVQGNYADRTCDFNSSQTGLIKSIKYPTGGTSTFQYEPNQISIQNYSDISSLSIYLQFSQSLVKNEIAGNWTNVQSVSGYGDEHNVSGSFTLANDGYYDVRIYQDLDPTFFESPIINFTGPKVGVDGIMHLLSQHTTLNSLQGQGIIFLPGGTYTYSLTSGVSCNDNTGNCIPLQANFDIGQWVQPSGAIPPYPIGGCRIAKIINDDGIGGNQILIKKYVYDDNLSHVVLRNIPNYLTSFNIGVAPDANYCLPCGAQYVLHDQNIATVAGANIEYLYVTEYDDEGGINGKTEYSFLPTSNEGGSNGEPYTPALNTYWRSGSILTKKTYKSTGTSFSLRSEIDNNYFNSNRQNLAISFRADYGMYCSAMSMATVSFRTNASMLFSEQFYKNQSIQTEYLEGNTISNISNISESSVYHTMPVIQEGFDSKNQSEKQKIIYSFDYNNNANAVSDDALGLKFIVSLNMIVPIEKIILKSINGVDYVISATLQTYKKDKPEINKSYSLKIGAPLLFSSFTQSYIDGAGNFIMDNHYEERLIFSKYDNFNNPIEITKSKDKTQAYIYDYKSYFPIAEVLNSDFASIAYTSFEADGNGNWGIGTGSADNTTSVTGNKSYNLNGSITKSGLNNSIIYLVSYWTRNASPFTISGTITGFPTKGRTINGWTLYVHKVTGQTTISINGSGLIDELRLYPADAQMTTYTYTPLVGMTSQCDVGNRITYYEYDGFQRLKRIRDQDYNILKTYEYQYQAIAGCGANCYPIPMQTFTGGTTLGYPVGVFSVSGKLLGNANNQSEYVARWNSDADDALLGSLATGKDSMHFNMTLNTGKTLPAGVTGCRYYQVDLAWNKMDGVTGANAKYVDFGDSTGMYMNAKSSDTPAVFAPNTTYTVWSNNDGSNVVMIHNYPTNSVKTLTFYHNDGTENEALDNALVPATSLLHLSNLRGNLPQNTTVIGGSCFQSPTLNSVAGITNWNSIHSIVQFVTNLGDGINPAMNLNYTQDFLKNNSNLQIINTNYGNGIYKAGYHDPTFKLSRLKSDWNTFFTQLTMIAICDEHWDREDLSGLPNLKYVFIYAGSQNHSNDPTNNLPVPIPSTVIDNIIIQVAAGAGKFIEGGQINMYSGGNPRTSASTSAVNVLKAKGWTITIEGITQ